jgi:hypothetical protein
MMMMMMMMMMMIENTYRNLLYETKYIHTEENRLSGQIGQRKCVRAL